jgi:drug/metabolite transporter (DMT)-like permease
VTPKNLSALLLLSALWGGSFLFMRIAAPALGPILLIELRVALATLALLGYGAMARKLPPLGPRWRPYLMIGIINSAVPFVLIATAELHLPASLAATLNATTPLFGALVAALWLREAFPLRRVLGLGLGFAGVAVLVGLGPIPLSPVVLGSIGLSLLAALSYGVAAVYTKVHMPGGQPQALATYSQLFAGVVLLPLLPFALPDHAPSGTVVGSVLALALLCTAFAYLLYFHLIITVGPTRATMVTYLSPAFGTLWGFLFLQEKLGPGSIAGFGLILLSVALVQAGPVRQRAGGVAREAQSGR